MASYDQQNYSGYRTAYIILVLFAGLGMMLCLFIYKYTDYFASQQAKGISVNYSLLGDEALFERFWDELKLLLVLYVCGFTAFALPAGILFALYRGFMCGFFALTLARAYHSSAIAASVCVLLLVSGTIIPALELCSAAKAQCHAAQLRYAAPDLGSLFRSRGTLAYTASFLFVCMFVFAFTFIVTLAPRLIS